VSGNNVGAWNIAVRIKLSSSSNAYMYTGRGNEDCLGMGTFLGGTSCIHQTSLSVLQVKSAYKAAYMCIALGLTCQPLINTKFA